MSATMPAMTTSGRISKRLRYEVMNRDDFRCRYCGSAAPDVRLTVDHVMPVALGGSSAPSNLVTACSDCNAGKSSVPPGAPLVADVERDALRWRQAMMLAAERQAAEQSARDAYVAQFREAWEAWTYPEVDRWGQPIADRPRLQFPLPNAWVDSIERFYDLGLEIARLVAAVDTAVGRAKYSDGAFAYLCGICWSVLRERSDIAREILDTEPGA